MQILASMNLRQFVGRHLKTPQIYQAFQGMLSIDEIKSLKQFLSTQKGQGNKGATSIDVDDEAEVIDLGNSDFIDMDDLIEAVQFKHEFDATNAVSPQVMMHPGAAVMTASAAELDSLQRKIARILREKDDDAEFYGSKIRQLKRSLKDANLEKDELQE